MRKNRVVLFTINLLLILLFVGCNKNVSTEIPENEHDTALEENVLETDDKAKEITQNQEDILRLYISADRTGTKESGISIEQGIRTALDEIEYSIDGYSIELVVLDHRGSTPRFDQHLNTYLEDDRAIAMFCGLHSPPLLANRDFINENEILLLDPWAAATPITRYPSEENWIFRLSIDDSKAGFVIAKHAMGEGYSKPFLLLEDTGWGEANEVTMSSALREYSNESVATEWFNWNLGVNQAKVILREVSVTGADVIFFVGNAPEGKVFAQAMSELPEEERLPIRSHWGITGGDFPKVIDKNIRESIDLLFIQTRFSFLNMDDNLYAAQVFDRAKKLFPETIQYPIDIEAPTGFVHSYDLTKILIQAMTEHEWTGNTDEDRSSLRNKLENINKPVEGLLKTYTMPFTVYTDEAFDAHEALGIEDYVMAKYGENNEIILLNE